MERSQIYFIHHIIVDRHTLNQRNPKALTNDFIQDFHMTEVTVALLKALNRFPGREFVGWLVPEGGMFTDADGIEYNHEHSAVGQVINRRLPKI